MTPLSFGWDTDAGPCLHAPGFPDVIAVSGDVFAWVNSAGLWFSRDNSVALYPFQNIQGFALSSTKCVVVMGASPSSGIQICAVDIHSGVVANSHRLAGRNFEVGADVCIVDHGEERVATAVSASVTLPLPVGARDARPKPWNLGEGVVWVDQQQVYRLAFGGRTATVGRLPSPPTSWLVGPHGCAVFECHGSVFGMAAGGGLIPLPSLDISTSRFNENGGEVLVATDDGTARIRLVDGLVLQRAHGRIFPVGFHDEPVVLDEDAGTVKTLCGRVIRAGFSPCAVSVYDGLLYGPGGTAWDLQTQRRLWSHAPLGGLFLVAHSDGVFQVDDRIVGFDRDGRKVSDVPFPVDEEIDGFVVAVEHDADGFHVQTEEGVVQLSAQGERRGFTVAESNGAHEYMVSQPELHDVLIGGTDGSCVVAGRVWCWTEDGMLASYPSQEASGR